MSSEEIPQDSAPTRDPETSQRLHQTPKPSCYLQDSKSLNEYSSHVPKAPNVNRPTSLPWVCPPVSSADCAPVSEQTTRLGWGIYTAKAFWRKEIDLKRLTLNCFLPSRTPILISNQLANSSSPPPVLQDQGLWNKPQFGGLSSWANNTFQNPFFQQKTITILCKTLINNNETRESI